MEVRREDAPTNNFNPAWNATSVRNPRMAPDHAGLIQRLNLITYQAVDDRAGGWIMGSAKANDVLAEDRNQSSLSLRHKHLLRWRPQALQGLHLRRKAASTSISAAQRPCPSFSFESGIT